MEKWEKDNRWNMVKENIKKVKGRRARVNHYSLGKTEVRVSEGRQRTEKTRKKGEYEGSGQKLSGKHNLQERRRELMA